LKVVALVGLRCPLGFTELQNLIPKPLAIAVGLLVLIINHNEHFAGVASFHQAVVRVNAVRPAVRQNENAKVVKWHYHLRLVQDRRLPRAALTDAQSRFELLY